MPTSSRQLAEVVAALPREIVLVQGDQVVRALVLLPPRRRELVALLQVDLVPARRGGGHVGRQRIVGRRRELRRRIAPNCAGNARRVRRVDPCHPRLAPLYVALHHRALRPRPHQERAQVARVDRGNRERDGLRRPAARRRRRRLRVQRSLLLPLALELLRGRRRVAERRARRHRRHHRPAAAVAAPTWRTSSRRRRTRRRRRPAAAARDGLVELLRRAAAAACCCGCWRCACCCAACAARAASACCCASSPPPPRCRCSCSSISSTSWLSTSIGAAAAADIVGGARCGSENIIGPPTAVFAITIPDAAVTLLLFWFCARARASRSLYCRACGTLSAPGTRPSDFSATPLPESIAIGMTTPAPCTSSASSSLRSSAAERNMASGAQLSGG